MSVALAGTWLPRGELPRFERLHPQLMGSFQSVTLIMPPEEQTMAAAANQLPGVRAIASERWRVGRNESLAVALEMGATHLMYSDFDRVLRWIECYPDELEQTIERIQQSNCLVIGRTARAFETHPHSLRESEQIINDVFAHITGLRYDICVAARGLSRAAAQRVLAESRVQSALGVDGEWIYLLQRAGYNLDYVEVEGMEWETADQYLPTAADVETQRRVAEAYDAVPGNWAQRVYVARQIIAALLEITRD